MVTEERTGVVATIYFDGTNYCGVGWTRGAALNALYETLYTRYEERNVPYLEESEQVRVLPNISLEGLYYAKYCYNHEELTVSALNQMSDGVQYWDDDWEETLKADIS